MSTRTHTHSDPNHPCNGCTQDCMGGWFRLSWGDGEYECREPAKYAASKKAVLCEACITAEDAHWERLAETSREDAAYEAGILPY